MNEAGIQMLAERLRQQLFGTAPVPPVSAAALAESRAALRQHGLEGKHGDVQATIELPLPPMQGRNVAEHFDAIGRVVAEPYLSLARNLAACTLPPMPTAWRIAPGWTRYAADTPAGVAVTVRRGRRPSSTPRPRPD